MVYINDQKFACEPCIKGHRSSSCTHNDRPLFEVKKKGRPVSQCEKCRELRKTRRVHAKCICGTEKPEQAMRPLHSTAKRFIPILPSLPNGLKDALTSLKGDLPPADPRARVDTLLNPCHCKDIWNCKCAAFNASSASTSSSQQAVCEDNGLATLALAAASLCCSPTGNADPIEDRGEGSSSLRHKHARDSCCHSSPKRHPKRLNRQSSSETPVGSSPKHILLPPILSLPPTTSADPASPAAFPEFPPLSSIVQLAGTGCTCGFDCSCPGCVEHRGQEYVSVDHEDCPGCGTCVDNQQGPELPTGTPFGYATSESSGKEPNFLEAFFAKAASIPPPPPERANARLLDPMNVTVYPPSLFGEPKVLDARGPAFGLVRLPKLECCAGRCGCPGDSCACGESCDGCCSEEHNGAVRPSIAPPRSSTKEQPVAAAVDVEEPRSCCCE